MAADTFRFTMDAQSEEALSEIQCPRCASGLAVHMPDPGLPDCLLATCHDCKTWYVMDMVATTLTPVSTLPARATSAAPKKRRVQDAKRARIG